MPDAGIIAALMLKAIGSLAGTVLAFLYNPPHNSAEFVTRLVFSFASGILFGDVVHSYLNWADTWQMDVAAAAITGMLSWFIMGAAVRIIGKWTPPK